MFAGYPRLSVLEPSPCLPPTPALPALFLRSSLQTALVDPAVTLDDIFKQCSSVTWPCKCAFRERCSVPLRDGGGRSQSGPAVLALKRRAHRGSVVNESVKPAAAVRSEVEVQLSS
ncbi:hypothetical protein SRHO_G00274420 [Serrasalmus rhombeus]